MCIYVYVCRVTHIMKIQRTCRLGRGHEITRAGYSRRKLWLLILLSEMWEMALSASEDNVCLDSPMRQSLPQVQSLYTCDHYKGCPPVHLPLISSPLPSLLLLLMDCRFLPLSLTLSAPPSVLLPLFPSLLPLPSALYTVHRYDPSNAFTARKQLLTSKQFVT